MKRSRAKRGRRRGEVEKEKEEKKEKADKLVKKKEGLDLLTQQSRRKDGAGAMITCKRVHGNCVD